MELKHSCNICHSTRLIKLISYSKDHLYKCVACGFVFSYPFPSLDVLKTFYSNYPREHLSPITQKNYHELLVKFDKYKKVNNLLDIGCGAGYFLKTAKTHGWNVYGIEFTNQAIESCKKNGIHAFKGMLHESDFKSGSFDIITLFEVIEHISTPAEELEMIHKYLRPGGICYITTPNFNSLSRFLFRNKWTVLAYPEHLSYFTPATIHTLLKKTGFDKITLKTPGFSISRCMRSLKITEEESRQQTNSVDEHLRTSFNHYSLLKFVKISANLLLNIFRAGDTIIAMYKKKL